MLALNFDNKSQVSLNMKLFSFVFTFASVAFAYVTNKGNWIRFYFSFRIYLSLEEFWKFQISMYTYKQKYREIVFVSLHFFPQKTLNNSPSTKKSKSTSPNRDKLSEKIFLTEAAEWFFLQGISFCSKLVIPMYVDMNKKLL